MSLWPNSGKTRVPWMTGMTIAVVKKSQIMFIKGYGKTAIDSDTQVTEHTLFLLGSISKSFTATLLLKLMEKQNPPLDLSTNIREMMEGGFVFFDKERTQNANLVDILAHRMGNPEHDFLRLDPSITRADLPRLFKHMTQGIKKFRESFKYSCMMYEFATYLTEKLANGQPWEDLVAKEIFAPLDMTSSTVVTKLQTVENAAQGYFEKSSLVPVPFEFIRLWQTWAGSGGIMSNAVDMAKYMNFHLSNVDKDGNKFMSDKNFAALHQEHNNKLSNSTVNKISKELEVPIIENGYGLGWKLGKYRGHDILQHSGTTYGYCSFITLFPEQEIGIFTAMNGNDKKHIISLLLHSFLSDVALEVTPYLNAESICSKMKRYADEKNSIQNFEEKYSVQNFEEYVGEYTNIIYGTLKIKNINSNLSLEYGNCKWILWKQKDEEKFLAKGTGMIKDLIDFGPITFQTEKEGVCVTIEKFGIIRPPRVKFRRPLKQKDISYAALAKAFGFQEMAKANRHPALMKTAIIQYWIKSTIIL
ncbi:uncharacterized protein LOC133198116 [Saccostrea echinata]|uniref:uncharacterized protein LOC133198116 n=1 Tax=Saccostrea echinata TaxID=191078 RepID=UPI002A8278BC|nr:uncharacterized protein LOC133198116 [Saccostrea echinata]